MILARRRKLHLIKKEVGLSFNPKTKSPPPSQDPDKDSNQSSSTPNSLNQ